VPASNLGRRGHEAALLPRNGAAESFVSFILVRRRLLPAVLPNSRAATPDRTL
jgi:hypothetical protein